MKDLYGREISYLRLSVTELCNQRCRYCMPEEGVCKKSHEEMMTLEEMLTAVRAGAAVGIRKVRVTGGEPLIKHGIVDLCRGISAIDGIDELCLTTNGILLPQYAAELRAAGVSHVNISLDTLRPERHEFITRIGRLDNTLKGLQAALDAGFPIIKLNSVLIGGFNDDEIPALVDLTRQYPVDLRFIELMPMYDSGDFGPDAYISGDRVLKAVPELCKCEKDSGVARMYQLPGAPGRVGLINPVSAHFCRECSRMRLTADGKLRPCLHSDTEFSLKGLDEAGMVRQFEQAVLAKPEWHGALSFTERSRAGRDMNTIGG